MESMSGSPLYESIKKAQADKKRLDRAEVPSLTRTPIVTVANQKGGVGKTTTAVNVAAALGQAGLGVVVIDIDPQGNASTALGVPHSPGTLSTYEVIIGQATLEETLQACPDVEGVLVCPATIDLAGAEVELVDAQARTGLLKAAIDTYLGRHPEVDVVLIDSPPSLGLLTLNALSASTNVLIPVQAEYYALEGLSLLVQTIEKVRLALNPDIEEPLLAMTMVDGRTRLAAEVGEEVRSHFKDQVLSTEISRSVRISEAPGYGETVITYDPRNPGAIAYRQLALELIEKLEEEQRDA